MSRRLLVGVAGLLGMCGGALGAFDTPASTPVAEKLTGTFIPGDSGVTPEGGDQIGVFDKDGVAGVFQFDSSGGATFTVKVYGDDPDTEEKEGPKVGDKVTFRFFDASTNSEVELVALNASGERVNVTFQGASVPELPIELPGLDLTPTRTFDLTPGSEGGGGGGDGEPAGQYDVNGDGKVNTEDAALVLRAVMRGVSTVDGATNVDVDGDGSVTTADAIEVLRNRS